MQAQQETRSVPEIPHRVRANTAGALVVPKRSTALTAIASGALEKLIELEPPGTTFTNRQLFP